MTSPRLASAVFALVTVAALSPARGPQVPTPSAPDLPQVRLTDRLGLQRLEDGRVVGTGPSYQVVWSDGEMTLTPYFGKAAPRELPLRFSFLEASRAGVQTRSRAARNLEPRVDVARHTVALHHPRGIVEFYELRRDGVKQSFVFDQLPEGEGDLVVRGHMTTELPMSIERADRLEFEDPGIGSISIDKVVGIDAHGRRCTGTLVRPDATSIELRLPAAFVDEATLPLVLDPLIGADLSLNPSSIDLDLEQPDVAYDATHNVFLAVFERATSATSATLLAQRIDGDNPTPLGSAMILAPSAVGQRNVRVAGVRVVERFVTAWLDNNGIQGRSVRAVVSSMGPARQLVTHPTLNALRSPQLGGESTRSDDEALLVWSNPALGRIEARQILAMTNGNLNLNGGVVNVSSGLLGTHNAPSISRSGGATGFHLIAWHRTVLSQNTIFARVVDRNLNVIDPTVAVTSNTIDAFNPAVDGNGKTWVVAYEVDEATAGNRNIGCRGVTLNNVANTPGVTRLTAAVELFTGNQDLDRNPAVCFLGDSAVIAYEDQGTQPTEFDIRLQSVDPLTCARCGPNGTLQQGFSTDSRRPSIASKRSGNPDLTSDFALFLWESSSVTTDNGDVFARGFRANDDGDARNLDGGCGVGGDAYATCAEVGNANFRHWLNASAPNAPAAFILSPLRRGAVCGPCELIPDPFNAFVFPTTTNALGVTSITTPIASVAALEGVRFYEQWVVLPAATPLCTPLGFDLSNALQVTIEN